MTIGDDFFLRIEQKMEKDHHHKLATFAEVTFKVTKDNDKTDVIKRPYGSFERVCHARVILAQKPRTVEEVNYIPKPTKDDLFCPADKTNEPPCFGAILETKDA